MALLPRFFIYEDAALDHSALLECVPAWESHDQSAEVAMLRQLERLPTRTSSPADAALFVLPLFPYLSVLAANCSGSTHLLRMEAAAASLHASRWYRRRRGADHLLVTNTFHLHALRPLRPLLLNATLAWFESPTAPRRGPGKLAAASFWRCTLVVPYVPSPFCRQQRLARPYRSCAPGRRRSSVFFQGSLNVTSIRLRLASVAALPDARIVDVPRAAADPPGGVEACRRDDESSCAGKLEFARRMLCSDLCLVPKGDTPTSSRFYSAIACGCVPLVISDDLKYHLPFARRVNYSFVQYIRERDFMSDPARAVGTAVSRLQPRLPALRAAMREAAPDLLFDEDGSRVAENMLIEYSESCQPARESHRSR
ncbi:hypothetical protein AB1Y20_012158 [Prymnesium parvum]|uniref:Exostosin GT47 domain-containing protein n=1 Tax=Prymnesium parvum TaxID=97485 RepID=A0AB34INZ4_PRYPA